MRLQDFQQLVAGVLVPPVRAWPGGRPNGLNSIGVRFVDDNTFKVWSHVPVAELWQWVALLTFLDPSTIPLEAAMANSTVPRMSPARLLQDRVQLAAKLVDADTIECLSRAADPKRSLVRVGAFRDWAERIGLPLPADFPRAASQPKRNAGRKVQPDANYLRQSDLIPALLPFSAATLWRKVKAGTFPAPVKLSDAVTAWRRADVEAWLVAQSQPATKRRARATS